MLMSVVVPVYKGRGKDPLNPSNYCGITITPVVSKVIESLLLTRIQLVFSDADVPHSKPSAHRRNILCADAIFATLYQDKSVMEVMYLYDLQKTFDSV